MRYHPVDGGVIAAQEEAYRQEMIEKYEAELSKQVLPQYRKISRKERLSENPGNVHRGK